MITGRGRAALRDRPRAWTPAALAVLLVAAGLPARPLAAQGWVVEARGGRIHHEAGPGAETSTGLVSVGRVARYGLAWGSVGLPLRETDPLWAGVSGWKRLAHRSGPLTLGLDLSGDVFAQRDRSPGGSALGGPLGGGLLPRPLPEDGNLSGWSAAGAAMPVLGLEIGPVGIEARAGVAAHASDFAGARVDRTLPQADLGLAWTASPGRALSLSGRHLRGEEGDWTRVGARARGLFGRAALEGEIGRWLGDAGPQGIEWSLAGRFPLADALALVVGGRRAAVDPLRLVPAHTSWSAGVSWSFGGPPRPAPPVPAAYSDGRAVISVGGQDAGPSPRIAGDFNGWTPEAMVRAGDEWQHTVALEPGVYYWALVAPDGTWFVPPSVAGRRDDGFGGQVATLIVEEAG